MNIDVKKGLMGKTRNVFPIPLETEDFFTFSKPEKM